MTGTTRMGLGALLLLLTACRSGTDTPPARVRGSLSVAVDFEYLGTVGEKKKAPADFTAALLDALKARGVTVEDGAQLKLTGRASLAEEAKANSKVGGPMAFFFVHGAYDYAVVDGGGRELGRVQGALDLRELKDKALVSAHASYEDTAKAIVADAAPRAADQIVELLWRSKAVTAN